MFLDSFEILLGFLQGIFSRFQGNQGKLQLSQRLKMLDVASLLVKGEVVNKRTAQQIINARALKLTRFDRSFSFFFYPISALLITIFEITLNFNI